MNNLYYLSKYIINIALLVIDSQKSTNIKLIIIKLRNNYIPKRAQNSKIINVESIKANFINNKNTKTIAKKFASLYQYIYK